MRPNVAKKLPLVRAQIKRLGYQTVRNHFSRGNTKMLSGKDRREMLLIIEKEYRDGTKYR